MVHPRPVYATLLFIGIVFSVILAGTAVRLAQNNPLTSEGWVHHTQTVYRELQAVGLSASHAESSERGYVITGQPEYLRDYQRAGQEANHHLMRVAKLTVDNQDQQADVTVLQRALEQRFAEIDQKISVYNAQGREAAARMLLAGHGKQTMQLLRQVVVRMQDREDNLLVGRNRVAVATYWFLVAVTVGMLFRDVVWVHVLWRDCCAS